MLKTVIVCGVVLALASCTTAPPGQNAAAPQPGAKPACHAGADAGGIAAGFFSLFTDDLNGCL